MWVKLRTVILQSAASEAADLYREQFARFEEAFDALQWLLARRDGLGFKQVRNGRTFWLYVQAGDDIAKAPHIWTVYETNDHEVVIHAIRAEAFVQERDDPTG